MSINLNPEHQEWLNEQLARSDFASAEDAVSQLIDARIALEQDDLAWAKSAVDEAVERGETITLDEHRSRNAVRLSALKD